MADVGIEEQISGRRARMERRISEAWEAGFAEGQRVAAAEHDPHSCAVAVAHGMPEAATP